MRLRTTAAASKAIDSPTASCGPRETIRALLDNRAPVANDDGFWSVLTGQPLMIKASDLLRNDSTRTAIRFASCGRRRRGGHGHAQREAATSSSPRTTASAGRPRCATRSPTAQRLRRGRRRHPRAADRRGPRRLRLHGRRGRVPDDPRRAAAVERPRRRPDGRRPGVRRCRRHRLAVERRQYRLHADRQFQRRGVVPLCRQHARGRPRRRRGPYRRHPGQRRADRAQRQRLRHRRRLGLHHRPGDTARQRHATSTATAARDRVGAPTPTSWSCSARRPDRRHSAPLFLGHDDVRLCVVRPRRRDLDGACHRQRDPGQRPARGRRRPHRPPTRAQPIYEDNPTVISCRRCSPTNRA